MEDRFTRRGFVGVLAAGAASTLWLPKARAIDPIRLEARWTQQLNDRTLNLTLWVKSLGSETHEAAPHAIELRAEFRSPTARHALTFEPIVEERRRIRTRSGRRIERRIFVSEREIYYDSFRTTLPDGLQGEGVLHIEARRRVSVQQTAERYRPMTTALAQIRAQVPVQFT